MNNSADRYRQLSIKQESLVVRNGDGAMLFGDGYFYWGSKTRPHICDETNHNAEALILCHFTKQLPVLVALTRIGPTQVAVINLDTGLHEAVGATHLEALFAYWETVKN